MRIEGNDDRRMKRKKRRMELLREFAWCVERIPADPPTTERICTLTTSISSFSSREELQVKNFVVGVKFYPTNQLAPSAREATYPAPILEEPKPSYEEFAHTDHLHPFLWLRKHKRATYVMLGLVARALTLSLSSHLSLYDRARCVWDSLSSC
jgi:hypothetical protein